jgi:hypothetical protein
MNNSSNTSEAEKNLQREIRKAEEIGMELDKYDDGKKVRLRNGNLNPTTTN